MDNNPFILSIKDSDIVDAYHHYRVFIEHTDAPSEGELSRLRDYLGTISCEPNVNMLSLHWLRNRIVNLRKSGRLN